MKHFNIQVIGEVQGVYYRALAREKADELGVKGFVRNEPDGSVYLEAEGDPNTLEKLVTWCRQGPPRAKVENVITKEAADKGFKRFEIIR